MTDEERVIKLQNDIAIKLWHKNYNIEARTKIKAEIERFKTEALLDEIIGNKDKDAEKYAQNFINKHLLEHLYHE